MRGRGNSAAHAEAVARRLELLGSELQPLRDGRVATGDGQPPEHTHIRALRAEGAAETRPAETGPAETGPVAIGTAIPMPGRHARRRGRTPADGPWTPGSLLAGRIDFGPAQIAVIAVVLAVGLGVTAWWVIRDDAGDPVPAAGGGALATPAVPSTGQMSGPMSGQASGQAGQPTPPAGQPGGSGSGTTAGEVVVDVAGKVRRPGIVVLPTGSRVADALDAVGGARRGVDLSSVNLARVLVDGEQILVGQAPVAGAAPSMATNPAPGDGSTLVNINTATIEELETLPGIGPVTAQSIIDWRTANGGFASVDQLLDVDGIGEKTLADLAPLVTI